jgi:hypothetical protein
MKKRIVFTNQPIRLPIQGTVLYTFLLHYFQASDLIWGIYITLCIIYWTIVFYGLYFQEGFDINRHTGSSTKRTIVLDRLKKLIEQQKGKDG